MEHEYVATEPKVVLEYFSVILGMFGGGRPQPSIAIKILTHECTVN